MQWRNFIHWRVNFTRVESGWLDIHSKKKWSLTSLPREWRQWQIEWKFTLFFFREYADFVNWNEIVTSPVSGKNYSLTVWEWKSTLLGVILGSIRFGVAIHSQNSGIRSQKSDSNHYFGVDSTIIWEWIQLQMKWSLIWKSGFQLLCIKRVRVGITGWFYVVWPHPHQ